MGAFWCVNFSWTLIARKLAGILLQQWSLANLTKAIMFDTRAYVGIQLSY